jgi:hypothetical protein
VFKDCFISVYDSLGVTCVREPEREKQRQRERDRAMQRGVVLTSSVGVGDGAPWSSNKLCRPCKVQTYEGGILASSAHATLVANSRYM